VLVGSANYEESDAAKPGSVFALGKAVGPLAAASDSGRAGSHLPAAALSEILTNIPVSIGPLAVADYDGDGQLDLFVGGRVKGGRYPEPVSSYLYKRRGGKLELDDLNSGVLQEIGLVSGAMWSELEGDGFAELVLACEWGPLRVFRNSKGGLKEATADLGLAEYSGWWNGVTAGDLNGDGRLDLIASNWGRNTPFRASKAAPRRVYFGDFNNDTVFDLLETCLDENAREVPDRDLNAISADFPLCDSASRPCGLRQGQRTRRPRA
jgi:hypothetical protein